MMNEPSVVAIRLRDNTMVAVGHEAYDMLGRCLLYTSKRIIAGLNARGLIAALQMSKENENPIQGGPLCLSN